MWKTINGKATQTEDETRTEIEVRVSLSILEDFDKIADEHDSFRNYVIENALINLLNKNDMSYNKKDRKKDRVRYRSTYDKELIESVRELAKESRLYIGDIIEYSLPYASTHTLKKKRHRYRIEKGE